jgi:preprotein translocase subunit YajC
MTAGVLVSAAGCAPDATATGGFDYTTLILLGVMVVAFYFLMIRPQQKRAKEQRMLLEDLKKGDKVITAGGMFGTIDSVEDETIIVKVESGATIRILKNSVVVKRES